MCSSQMEEESEEAIGLAVALERIAAFSKSVCLSSDVLQCFTVLCVLQSDRPVPLEPG